MSNILYSSVLYLIVFFFLFHRDGPKVPQDEDHLPSQGFVGTKESFMEYLDWDFFVNCAEKTNLYSVQNTTNHRSLNCTPQEIMRFTAVEILMGCLGLPQAKLYWSREVNLEIVSNIMPRDRYFELRNNLHFVNNLDANSGADKLWKVRPLVDSVNRKCLTLPRSSHLSIDEQMIPFAGKCAFRTYVPSKPNPLGLKNFVLAASDGLILDFKIYTGTGFISEETQKDLGLGAGVVAMLSQTIPKTVCYMFCTQIDFLQV